MTTPPSSSTLNVSSSTPLAMVAAEAPEDGALIRVESSVEEEEAVSSGEQSVGLSAQLDALSSTSSFRQQRLQSQKELLEQQQADMLARLQREQQLLKLQEEEEERQRRSALEASLARRRLAQAKAEAEEEELKSKARLLQLEIDAE
jgi:colicin import membrane protein